MTGVSRDPRVSEHDRAVATRRKGIPMTSNTLTTSRAPRRLPAPPGRRSVRLALAVAAASVPLAVLAPLADAAVASPASPSVRVQSADAALLVPVAPGTCRWLTESIGSFVADPCRFPPRCGRAPAWVPMLWCPPVPWPRLDRATVEQVLPELTASELTVAEL